jgi:hypothetical protein
MHYKEYVMNKEPVCPATREISPHPETGEYVSICNIIFRMLESGDTKYPNYMIPPIHCEHYTDCPVWRQEKINAYIAKRKEKK